MYVYVYFFLSGFNHFIDFPIHSDTKSENTSMVTLNCIFKPTSVCGAIF